MISLKAVHSNQDLMDFRKGGGGHETYYSPENLNSVQT